MLKNGDVIYYPKFKVFGEVRGNEVFWLDGARTDIESTQEWLDDGVFRHATKEEIENDLEKQRVDMKLDKVLKELTDYERERLLKKLKREGELV